MRSAAALASARDEVAQVRYSSSGNFAGSRRPGFGTDRELRQRLGNVIDRFERVQRTSASVADFIEAGGDRRLDVLTASGAGISLPFTPGRNHRVILATLEATTIFIKSFSPRAAFLLDSEYLTVKKSVSEIFAE